MEIISGKQLADEIKSKLQSANQEEGISPCLAMIDVGENPENSLYIGLKETAVKFIGGQAKRINLPATASPVEVLTTIRTMNDDHEVHGILLQLPLPADLEPHRESFLEAIVPYKDVDGFCPHNRGLLIGSEPVFVSCAAQACLEVSRQYAGPLQGKKVLLVGNSFDVIQPLALLFIKEKCLVSIVPQYSVEHADGVDVAVIEHGTPLQVKQQAIKPGALVIDAGFHWFDNRTCGNVDRDALAEIPGYLLPVPGGLGPLLIAHLMTNLSRAARKQ